MILDTKRVVIELEYRGTVPVEDAAGTRINCLRGRIWITEHRSTGDIVLEAGQSYEVSRDGVAVVQALREACITLCAPAMSPVRPGLAKLVAPLWSRWIARGLHTPVIVQAGAANAG